MKLQELDKLRHLPSEGAKVTYKLQEQRSSTGMCLHKLYRGSQHVLETRKGWGSGWICCCTSQLCYTLPNIKSLGTVLTLHVFLLKDHGPQVL